MAPLKDRPTKAERQTWHPVNYSPFFFFLPPLSAQQLHSVDCQSNVPTSLLGERVPGKKPTTLTAYVKCKYLVTVLNHHVSKWYSFFFFFCKHKQTFRITEVKRKKVHVTKLTNDAHMTIPLMPAIAHNAWLFSVFVLCLCVQKLLLAKRNFLLPSSGVFFTITWSADWVTSAPAQNGPFHPI